jgi:LacI family transcriptional regulator
VRAIQAVADAGVPVVQLGEPCDEKCPTGISNVTVDVRNTVQLAVSHLVSLGHRRIALCSGQGSRYFGMVTEAFRAAMGEHGISAGAQEWYVAGDNVTACAKLPAWLADLAEPPTALIVEEATRATLVVRVLETNGWPVPERVSVVAITAAATQPRSMEGLTCVVNPMRECILRAADILLENICSHGHTARAEKIVATFVPGDTCRALGTVDPSR